MCPFELEKKKVGGEGVVYKIYIRKNLFSHMLNLKGSRNFVLSRLTIDVILWPLPLFETLSLPVWN